MKVLNNTFFQITSVLIMLIAVQSANATIININSLSNNEINPVSILFDAGTYDVTQIGVSDGGSFDAWNAWNGGQINGCDINGENCSNGWLNWFYFSSAEFGEILNWDGNIYANSSLALLNGVNTSFTLTASSIVNFYIKDGVNGSLAWDNTGGISLNVGSTITAVPTPPIAYLFGLGLIGVLVSKWKCPTKYA